MVDSKSLVAAGWECNVARLQGGQEAVACLHCAAREDSIMLWERYHQRNCVPLLMARTRK